MAPGGGVILGMSRSVRDGVVSGYEFLILRTVKGNLVYSAFPSGQTPTDFPAVAVSQTFPRFENPSHDFPKRIEYVNTGPDSIVARVYGEIQLTTPAFEVHYGRTPCPAGHARR